MIGGQVQPYLQPELNRLSESMQTRGPGTWFQNIFQERNNMAVLARAVNHRSEICGLTCEPQAPLFHKARRRKRARDDVTYVDRTPPRLTGRLGPAIDRRQRPQHLSQIPRP